MKNNKLFWTKKKCIAHAKKYQYRIDWQNASGGAYTRAQLMGWLDECCKHMIPLLGYWTKKRCIEEAKKYTNRTDFTQKASGAYAAAKKYNWIDLCTQHMIGTPKNFWTRERCINDAKKYSIRSEWQRSPGNGYNKALRMGWLNACCKHMQIQGNTYKRLIYAIEFSDKTVYIGLTFNHQKRFWNHLNDPKSAVYQHIKRNNLKPKLKILTKFLTIENAVVKEKQYINHYQKNNWTLLNKAKAGSLGGNIIKWSKIACINDAKKYSTKGEWHKKSGSAYGASKRNGSFKDCIKHMPKDQYKLTSLKLTIWTKEKCLITAKKCSSQKEFRKKFASAYRAAIRNQWLKEINNTFSKKMEILNKI